MGFSKLISNSSDVLRKTRRKHAGTPRQRAIQQRFDDMRGNLSKDSTLKDQQLIDNMEIGFLNKDKDHIDFVFNEAKQRKDTWKFGNSDFMKNPSNSTKYDSKAGQDLTRTSRAGTGDLGTDGDYWLDLPEGQRATVVKKL